MVCWKGFDRTDVRKPDFVASVDFGLTQDSYQYYSNLNISLIVI